MLELSGPSGSSVGHIVEIDREGIRSVIVVKDLLKGRDGARDFGKAAARSDLRP